MSWPALQYYTYFSSLLPMFSKSLTLSLTHHPFLLHGRSNNPIRDSCRPPIIFIIGLHALAAEVMKVTLKVGSQGELGGQAHVPDVEGVWFELVWDVGCFMFSCFCSNLTWAILGKSDVLLFDGPIAVVTTALTQGDLMQKIEIQVEGEMSTLKGIFVVWFSDNFHHSWMCVQVSSTIW